MDKANGMCPRVLVGCGILHKEIEMLIKRNGWPVTCHFSCSSLHVDFNRLRESLESNLDKYKDRNPTVFYGTCHPQMEQILNDHCTQRTLGQNCIEILLGQELFQTELAKGAFFLLEDWAQKWRHVIVEAMGDDPSLWAEIFQSQHRYILAIRTPCSEDFTGGAEAFAKAMGLPLRWMDATTEHLESALRNLFMGMEN
ncbi:MAG: DUF1638 domain-containing protein [Planctomycetes bacterium]|nr:DUF1638 domain-containing protein [Planctomycetota bacterium]